MLQTKPFIAFLNRSSGIKRGQPHNAYNIIITDTKQRQPLCFFLYRCPSFRADILMLFVGNRKINEKFLSLFQTLPDKGSLYLQ